LSSFAVNGLINHIKQGGTPPNANYVKALQKRWKAVKLLQKIRMFSTVEFNLLWGKIVTLLSMTAHEFFSHLTRKAEKVSLVIS
jgi:hypothetical protein